MSLVGDILFPSLDLVLYGIATIVIKIQPMRAKHSQTSTNQSGEHCSVYGTVLGGKNALIFYSNEILNCVLCHIHTTSSRHLSSKIHLLKISIPGLFCEKLSVQCLLMDIILHQKGKRKLREIHSFFILFFFHLHLSYETFFQNYSLCSGDCCGRSKSKKKSKQQSRADQQLSNSHSMLHH